MLKWPGSQEPIHSGYSIANGEEKSFFDVINADPRRAQRFKEAMIFFQHSPGFEDKHVINAWDWSNVNLVIDVGGSHGNICSELAKHHPNLHAIVQDAPEVIAEGAALLPAELKDRVTFQAHDFFQEQEKRNAEVFFLRWILHDWSDKHGVDDWVKVLAQADPRFTLRYVKMAKGALLALIVIGWDE